MSNDYFLPWPATGDLAASSEWMPGVKRPPVPLGGVCLVGCFFAVSACMMLGCFAVVTRGVCVVLAADCF